MINFSEYTYRELISHLLTILGKSKNGSTRRVWLDTENSVVIKLPIITEFSYLNEQEHENYFHYISGASNIPVAECNLEYTKDKIAVIVMELVREAIYEINLPDWCKSSLVDSRQVGYNKRGELVCFDHA